MFDSSSKPWYDGLCIPKSPSSSHATQEEIFAGAFIGAILYGVVVILFFQFMGTLFDPAKRTREGIRWGLVAYTTAAFSFVTTFTVTNLHRQSVSFIDDRNFSGASPGPVAYQSVICAKLIYVVPIIMFMLNNWLADGVLLYRCCIIYAMNYWAITFPCLMYLASLAMGVMPIYYQATQPLNVSDVVTDFKYPYFSISLSLNVLLTLMIIVRLVLRGRSVRNVVGAPAGTAGLYKTTFTMIIESSALYAVTYVLFLGSRSAGSSVVLVFFPILANTQVIAPFLILLRVVNRRALTSDIIVSGGISPTCLSQGESTGGSELTPGGKGSNLMGTRGETLDELAVTFETDLDVYRDGI